MNMQREAQIECYKLLCDKVRSQSAALRHRQRVKRRENNTKINIDDCVKKTTRVA